MSRNISFIGSGNAGYNIACNFYDSGHRIVQIQSMTLDHAKRLARKVEADYTDKLSDLRFNEADLVIIAVKDDAIEDVISQLPESKGDTIFVHTSGTVGMDVFKPVSDNYGVIYPIQSLRLNKVIRMERVPICISGSNQNTLDALDDLARSISRDVHHLDDQSRLTLHIAAVFAHNFPNHLFGIAQDLLKDHDIKFKLLIPMIQEMIDGIASSSDQNDDGAIRARQTGPAFRGDNECIAKHVSYLTRFPDACRTYETLTESIQSYKKLTEESS